MGRSLPWSLDHTPPPKKRRVSPTAPKREEASSPSQSENARGKKDTADRSPRKGSCWSTPARSSPRAPASTELMREGYDGDDIYIMVEDEFQTIAQSYTADLHHAEYTRLVKQAREAAPKALPDPTSPMSKEARRRLEAAALQKKQKDTVRKAVGRTSGSRDEEEEDSVVDLWSGTSLAPLMASGSQHKTSLLGLERMSRSTKAGMGFPRPRSSGDSGREGELDGGLPEASRTRGAQISRDDNASKPRTEGDVSGAKGGHPPIDGSSRQSRKDSFAPEDDPEVGGDQGRDESRMSRLGRPPRGAGNTFLKRKLEKEQDKKSRLEEVPMFII